jgi:group I intron endonuclease
MKSLVTRGNGIKVGVYKIYTPTSPKLYIGSSFRSFSNRYYQHVKELNQGIHGCQKLQNAYNKYGADNFYFEILEQYDKSQFDSRDKMIKFVLSREQFYLDKYPKELKYNIVPLAGTNAGFHHSEEFKVNKSKQMKGRSQHPNTYSAVISANTGRKATEDHRQKLSNYWRGRKKTKASIQKRVKKMRGRAFSNRRMLLLCSESYEILKVFNSDKECAAYLNRAASTVRTCAANCGKINGLIVMFDSYPIVNKRIKNRQI